MTAQQAQRFTRQMERIAGNDSCQLDQPCAIKSAADERRQSRLVRSYAAKLADGPCKTLLAGVADDLVTISAGTLRYYDTKGTASMDDLNRAGRRMLDAVFRRFRNTCVEP